MTMRRTESDTSKRRLEAKAKQVSALEYRKMGATYQQIADQVGYNSAQAAHDAVKRALDDIRREPTEAVRELELQRLDALLIAHWPRATSGDSIATSRCLEIMARRARMLGLDAPEKLEASGPGGEPLAAPVLNIRFVSPAAIAAQDPTDGAGAPGG